MLSNNAIGDIFELVFFFQLCIHQLCIGNRVRKNGMRECAKQQGKSNIAS